ncbi:hypothetical protein CEXT_780921 [Caerostris extrusa]|uniref:Uncharacterized protein n=1 Tax=Caerostris extrusa TaxID=172846 RepID=A0AAV4YAS6_CAEEX|nr:hypothetical protein CEXT_780921 [Caerostris extrusa]
MPFDGIQEESSEQESCISMVAYIHGTIASCVLGSNMAFFFSSFSVHLRLSMVLYLRSGVSCVRIILECPPSSAWVLLTAHLELIEHLISLQVCALEHRGLNLCYPGAEASTHVF